MGRLLKEGPKWPCDDLCGIESQNQKTDIVPPYFYPQGVRLEGVMKWSFQKMPLFRLQRDSYAPWSLSAFLKLLFLYKN